ncbi:prolyl-tRNA synthetase [Raphidocelis subcapitata]|uniref:Prolyl-tRNA synthetase n=1 Tax=Raphidocelis subcapitata TaxID=307507 RepID=A0A2V0PFG0_9CHLO|nr:prolyl-tRNA synthetase [Raphidocelis subcapitata]|eukprot:GBF98526.1 prolyl-tRNA synthetase [Raphidocelis subcapitata]
MAAAEAKAAVLAARFDALEGRAAAAERAAALAERLTALLQRIAAAEEALESKGGSSAAPAAASAPAPAPGAAAAPAPAPTPAAAREPAARAALEAALAGDDSPVQHRLARELCEMGVPDFRFVRVPSDYYDRPLEWRQSVLGAASVHHLCKSIVMENTRAHPSVSGWDDPHNARYYCVIVQYTARFNNEKLCAHLHKLNAGKGGGGGVGKKWFNMRLCPEDVSDQLSGFGHNGVSPVGLAARLPIIISHRILQLQPDFFFCGGGEVDLKLGMPAAAFVEAYRGQPVMVVDCTYDDGDAGGEGGGGDGEGM